MTSGRRRIRAFFWVLVGLGLLAALWSAGQRWRVEARNRSVEIALDYTELRTLAAAEGVPLDKVLARFRAAGAVSVAISEDTIGGLEESRRIAVDVAGRDHTLIAPGAGGEDRSALLARVEDALKMRTPYRIQAVPGPTPTSGALDVDQPYSLVRTIGAGLDPEAVADVRGAGLAVVGRVSNWTGVTPEGIQAVARDLKIQGVDVVIFLGDSVLGYKGYIARSQMHEEEERVPTTQDALDAQDLLYGTVEFVKQSGDGLLAKAAQNRTVRVHTISGAEMVTATIPDNIQRFLLAARERNIRLLFVRLFTSEPKPLEANVEYVEKIRKGLERGGLTPGSAHGYAPLEVPAAMRAVMGIGIAAGFLLLLDSIVAFSAGGLGLPLLLVAGAGALSIPVMAAFPGTMGPKVAALASACIFPTLALVRTDLLHPGDERPSVPSALLQFLGACAITLAGAMFIVGLLADRTFLIKADAFAGIKAAQMIPLLIVAVVYGLGLWASAERPWPRVTGEARRRVDGFLMEPILTWQAVAAIVALIVVAMVLLRSGNDPGVGVSPIELKIRALLDRLLYARPRFKEFLIGHPALILALLMAARGQRRWAIPVLLVGAIGQISLLNTFCHLHTPLMVGGIRALLGIVIGAVIGIAVYAIAVRLPRRGTSIHAG